MVWRQLPKLIPAGSIPVSRSKKKNAAEAALFFCAEKQNTPAATMLRRALCFAYALYAPMLVRSL